MISNGLCGSKEVRVLGGVARVHCVRAVRRRGRRPIGGGCVTLGVWGFNPCLSGIGEGGGLSELFR